MGGWQDWTQLVLPYLATDLLESDLLSKLAPSQSYALTMEHGYGGLIIATDAPAAATITCQVVDGTGIIPPWTQRKVVSTAGGVVTFAPPYAYPAACTPLVTLTSSVNQTASSSTFIFGNGAASNAMNGVKMVRPDGRDYPTGSLSAFAFNTGPGTFTVISAPGAGLRILVRSAVVWGGASTSFGDLRGTLSGNVYEILPVANGQSMSVSYESGLLLDANTAVVQAFGAANSAGCSLAYDIVS